MNEHYLWASLIWSSIGVGYWIYGKRQVVLSAMLGGVAITVASWFIPSAFVMSLVCLGLMFGVYFFARQGY